MENKLDKYFKDNLHDRNFEMKEEYWLGAEKLLDAHDRRRKRRVNGRQFAHSMGAEFSVLSSAQSERRGVFRTEKQRPDAGRSTHFMR